MSGSRCYRPPFCVVVLFAWKVLGTKLILEPLFIIPGKGPFDGLAIEPARRGRVAGRADGRGRWLVNWVRQRGPDLQLGSVGTSGRRDISWPL